ncbi:MAG: hypothetical protein AABM32_04240 [Chloroflexota bacterium]
MNAVLYLLAAIVAAAAAAVGWLARPLSPDPRDRAQFTDAVNAVDRELAANLELTTMFDQTKQAVTLENGEFARHSATLARNAPPVAAAMAALYDRMSEAESAMERRGPANSLRPADRQLIEGWEGDAREVQRSLRSSLMARPLMGWRALSARLYGRFARH